MLKKRIQMMDVCYFLMDKFGYRRAKVVSKQLDIWLYNKSNAKFPLVRLTTESLMSGRNNKSEVITQAKQLSVLFQTSTDLLNIHFDDALEQEYFEPDYYQTIVNDNYMSPILKSEFEGFQFSLLPISDDLENDLKRRELQLIDLHNKPSKRQRVSLKDIKITHIIIGINVLFYLAGLYLTNRYSSSFSLIAQGGLYKTLVYGANEWYRIFTTMFIHADILHLLMNMIALLQVGVLVERVYGKRSMLTIYFGSGIFSSLLALINTDGSLITIGASGAIFGLIGAVLVYLYSSGLYKVPQIRSQIIRILMVNLIISFFPGISLFGHLGGILGGLLISVFVSKAETLKNMKIHAIISTAILTVGLFYYALMMDENVYGVKPQLDKHIVACYYDIGLEDYAVKLDNKLIDYYEKIGEDYE